MRPSSVRSGGRIRGTNDLKSAILESITAASSPLDNIRQTLAELESSIGSAFDNVLLGLEALILALAAARPDDALLSLDRLNALRRAFGVRS